MNDELMEKINNARKWIAEAERYAELYQMQFKQQANQSIQYMQDELDHEKIQNEKALQQKKEELANIQKEIEAGNVKELLNWYREKG